MCLDAVVVSRCVVLCCSATMADSDESKLSGAKRRAPDSTVPAPTAGGSPVPGAGAGAGAGSSSSATAGSNWGRRLTPEEEARRARFVTNRKAHNPLYYSDYLQLDKVGSVVVGTCTMVAIMLGAMHARACTGALAC